MKTLGIAIGSALLAVFFVGLLGWPGTRSPSGAGPTTAAAVSVPEALTLDTHQPPEDARRVFDERFTLDNSVESLATVRAALDDFRALTERCQGESYDALTSNLPHATWRSQNLILLPTTDTIEGTLRKQQYRIAALEYELAQRRHAAREAGIDAVEQAHARYEQAAQAFQAYWDSFNDAVPLNVPEP